MTPEQYDFGMTFIMPIYVVIGGISAIGVITFAVWLVIVPFLTRHKK